MFDYRKYIKSLYWSVLTLTTIGETPEPITNLVIYYIVKMNRSRDDGIMMPGVGDSPEKWVGVLDGTFRI